MRYNKSGKHWTQSIILFSLLWWNLYLACVILRGRTVPKQGPSCCCTVLGKYKYFVLLEMQKHVILLFFLKQQKYSIFELISNTGCIHICNKSWWTLGQFAVPHCSPKHKGTEPNHIAAIITEIKIDHIFKDAFLKKTYFWNQAQMLTMNPW